MAVHSAFPPFVFLARFPISCVPSLLSLSLPLPLWSLVIWRVWVIDIPANGCLALSRSFTRVSLYISNVCMQLVLLYNPDPPSISPDEVYLGFVHICTVTRSPPFLMDGHVSCRRLLFNLYLRSLFCSHPQSSLTVTAHRLVRCSCVSRNQCISRYLRCKTTFTRPLTLPAECTLRFLG